MHHNINLIQITNKMRQCSRNLLFQCFLIAQHVSSDTPLIIRSSKTVIAASGFTFVCVCRQLATNTKATNAIRNKIRPPQLQHQLTRRYHPYFESYTPLNAQHAIAASGFTYVYVCRQLPANTNACKTRGCNYSF